MRGPLYFTKIEVWVKIDNFCLPVIGQNYKTTQNSLLSLKNMFTPLQNILFNLTGKKSCFCALSSELREEGETRRHLFFISKNVTIAIRDKVLLRVTYDIYV
jgi:hypothetical protein